MLFYEDIFIALRKEGIGYVVVGGLAVVLHGVVRLTADLDLIVALEKNNIQKFIRVMEKLGYRPKAPVNALDLADAKKRQIWIHEKNMKTFSFYHRKDQYKLVDVFVTEPIPFKLLNKNKKMIKAGRIVIPICSMEHLVKLKKIACRPQDLADIAALKKIKK